MWPVIEHSVICDQSQNAKMLPKPTLNHNSTQPKPNKTLVLLDMKITCYISAVTTRYGWNSEHLEQIQTVIVMFVQATYVLVTFVQLSNISAVTVSILTKHFGTDFLWALIFKDQHCILHMATLQQTNVSSDSFVQLISLKNINKT